MLVDFEERPSVLKVEKHVDANATPVWDPMSMQSLHEQGSGGPRHLAVEWEATASLCTKVLVPGYRPTWSCRGRALSIATRRKLENPRKSWQTIPCGR